MFNVISRLFRARPVTQPPHQHSWVRLTCAEAEVILGHAVLTDIDNFSATDWCVYRCSGCGKTKIESEQVFV